MSQQTCIKCAVCGRFVPRDRWGIPVCVVCEDLPEKFHERLMYPWNSASRVKQLFAQRSVRSEEQEDA